MNTPRFKNGDSIFRLFYGASLLVVLATVVLVSMQRQSQNWDILPYMYLILEGTCDGEGDSCRRHAEVYQIAEEQLSREHYQNLRDQSSFRRQAHRDCIRFTDILDNHRIKPLYVMTAKVAYLLGVPLTKATLIPNYLSYLGICFFIYFWMARSIHNDHHVFLICVLIFIHKPFVDQLGISSPDLLSSFFVILCLGVIALGRSTLELSIVACLAFFARIDNIIFILIFFGYIYARKLILHKRSILAVLPAILLAALSMVLYLYVDKSILINYLGNFYPSKYLENWLQIVKGLVVTDFLMIVGISLLLLKRLGAQERIAVTVVLVLIIVRLVIIPSFQHRFFIGYEVFLLAVILKAISNTITLKQPT